MGTTTRVITASAVGAGSMYLLDPERGRRRRAILRDKAAAHGDTVERRELAG